MPRARSIAAILLCAVLAGPACSFNARGLPSDGGGEGINWYRDGTIWPDGSLQLDFGKPSVACKISCPLGCYDAVKRCYRIKPSNFHALTSDAWFDDMTADVAPVSGLLIFHTDSGKVEEAGVERRPPDSKGQAQNGIFWDLLNMPPGHQPLGVFGVNSLTVTKPVRMEIKGKAAFAIYVRGNVIIDGEVVAGPEGQKPGAGGFAGGSSDGLPGAPCLVVGQGQGGKTHGNSDSGGGGGGGRRFGGQGGKATGQGVLGGLGGAMVGNSALAPILGGCGGGAGAGSEGGHGGGGGGAIQITANGTIVVDGKINVPGAGGGAGSGNAGGGGGGAGGAILLEAFGVQINGFLAANGGGGGGGLQEGNAGQISLYPATGGPAASYTGGGGNGGAYNIEQGSPGKPAYNGGGGGGSAGNIRINANAILFTGPNASPRPVEDKSGVHKW